MQPEPNHTTYDRTSTAVGNWLNGLLATKDGAGFEELVVHVRSEVLNEEIDDLLGPLKSTYTYAGERYNFGDTMIREDHFPI